MNEELKNVSNSNKINEKDTHKKIEPPTMKGKVKVKKRSGIVKFAEAFLPDDVSDVKGYILSDVVVPSIKKIIDEIFHIILWGSTEALSSRRSSSRTSYQNYYDRKRSRTTRTESSVYILNDDFVFEYEEDAQDFVRWMLDVIEEDGFIRLSEANEQAGRSGYYTDNKYGWSNLNGWRIVDTRRNEGNRFVLKLPRPFPID